MQLNWYIILATGIIPNIIGFVWYGPFFGKIWAKESGFIPGDKPVNLVKMTGLTLLFGIMLAVALTPIVIHQVSVQSALSTQDFYTPDSELKIYLQDFMSRFGTNFRTFKHGMLHGFISGLFLFFPVIGCNALYEGKSFRYTLINSGFWTVCAMIMGGIICAFA
jgi:hypothetical protein